MQSVSTPWKKSNTFWALRQDGPWCDKVNNMGKMDLHQGIICNSVHITISHDIELLEINIESMCVDAPFQPADVKFSWVIC